MADLDFSQVKGVAIPEGEVIRIEVSGTILWKKGGTNQVPISTDTDGSIYNGVGYKNNVRLSSSGGISSSAQSGSATTGFIPFPVVDGITPVIRMKGVEWKNMTGGHFYINFYDGSKKFLDYFSASADLTGNYDHVVTVVRDDATGIETFDFNDDYGTTNAFLQNVRGAAFIRITAKGDGADMIVTINEEIE